MATRKAKDWRITCSGRNYVLSIGNMLVYSAPFTVDIEQDVCDMQDVIVEKFSHLGDLTSAGRRRIERAMWGVWEKPKKA